MATYRAYFLDSESHITSGFDLEAATDEEAVNIGKEWASHQAVEIWIGPMMLQKIEPSRGRLLWK